MTDCQLELEADVSGLHNVIVAEWREMKAHELRLNAEQAAAGKRTAAKANKERRRCVLW